jgi:hypothetical protein
MATCITLTKRAKAYQYITVSLASIMKLVLIAWVAMTAFKRVATKKADESTMRLIKTTCARPKPWTLDSSGVIILKQIISTMLKALG